MNYDRWQHVDSVANVFLSCYNNRDTRAIRLSCELKEPVNPEILQKALDTLIEDKDQFQVRIRRGIFWYYIENAKIRPVVTPEQDRICPLLYHPQKENELLYSVTWFGNRINFEVFHAICDGTGAMEFFNDLLLCYLEGVHGPVLEPGFSFSASTAGEREEDSFKKFQGQESLTPGKAEKAYFLRGGKLPYDQLQFFDVLIPLKEMLAHAKKNRTTLTVYLAALLMKSILTDMSGRHLEKPVSIAVPVNLRNYFPSRTSRNFFIDIMLTHKNTGDETIESLAEELKNQLERELEPENIKARMNYYQKVQENAAVRAVPLFLKEQGIRFLTKQEDKNVSAVISNLGPIKVPDEMKPYIDHYCVYGSSENLFMAVSSFQEKLVVNFISPYKKTGVIRDFVREISSEIDHVRVYASEVIR